MDISSLIARLSDRGFDVKYFESGEETVAFLAADIGEQTVGFGGSSTLEELGLYEKLRERSKVFWHWKQPASEARERAAEADVYICSANAIAETGEIVNIDRTGNRVASTNYGHRAVYIVIGVNKIAPDLETAVWRVRNVAAPKNAQRLGLKTPCALNADKCYDCNSPQRICRVLNIIMRPPGGIEKFVVVLVNQKLGC